MSGIAKVAVGTVTEERGLGQNSTQATQKETTCQQVNLALLASGTKRESKPGFLEPHMFVRLPQETDIVTQPGSQNTSISPRV